MAPARTMKNMRPLMHPAMEDVTVEGILHALSDPVRVAIYADIVGSVGSLNCSNFLKVSEKTIPKSTLSQHFKALREAGVLSGAPGGGGGDHTDAAARPACAAACFVAR